MKNDITEYWFFLVIITLVALFYETISSANLSSILFWVRSGFLLGLLMMSGIVAIEHAERKRKVQNAVKTKIKGLEKMYSDEIKRKSADVEKIEREKIALLNSALNQARKTEEISEQARKLSRVNERIAQRKE